MKKNLVPSTQLIKIPKIKKDTLIILILTIIISLFLILSNKGFQGINKSNNALYSTAKVLAITDTNLSSDSLIPNLPIGYQNINVEILDGKFKGEKYNIKNNLSRMYNINVNKDMKVLVCLSLRDDKVINASVYSYKRDNVLFGLIAVFFLALVLVGRSKGVKSIFSLAFTVIVVTCYLVPSIFKGQNPLISSTISAILITVISLLLINGTSKKAYTAILGTILGVLSAGIIAFVAGNLSHISFANTQQADEILTLADVYKFNPKGLLYTIILISSLGAIMDISMSISSALFEFDSVNKSLSARNLFKSGMNVGKDIIGTMSNTLILAFVGTSLTLMLFIYSSQMPYTQLINLDVLSNEIIQALSGSIGIILTVPLTAAIGTFFIKKHKAA